MKSVKKRKTHAVFPELADIVNDISWRRHLTNQTLSSR